MYPFSLIRGTLARWRYERGVRAALGVGREASAPEAGSPVVDVICGKRYPRTERKPCPLCGQYREPRRLQARFGMIAMVSECDPCRIAYQTPMPTPEATLAYMNALWGSSLAYMGNESSLGRARVAFTYLQHEFPKPGYLLDFGAGTGAFVRVALESGWKAHGVERSSTAIERAKAENHVVLTPEVGDDGYDVITMWDVIEHLRDPAETLVRLKKHLRPGGRIILETGNWECWLRLAQGDRWDLYQMDHHYYFSPQTLNAYLEGCGYGNFRLVPRALDLPSRLPGANLRDWFYQRKAFRLARIAWPEHGGHNLIVASVSA